MMRSTIAALCLIDVLLLFYCFVAVVLLVCYCCLDCSDYSLSVYFYMKFHTDIQTEPLLEVPSDLKSQESNISDSYEDLYCIEYICL